MDFVSLKDSLETYLVISIKDVRADAAVRPYAEICHTRPIRPLSDGNTNIKNVHTICRR